MTVQPDRAALGQDARAFPIVVVGHVDHGKSTLVGRLLHDTDSLPPEKVAQLREVSARRGLDIEWSFLLDALQLERDQGITVDTTQIWFSSARRRYVIIDAPGHKEFLKNMVTGAAQAHAAVLVVDAAQGLAEQTRRHAYLLKLLGLTQVVVAVNKIDLIGHDQGRFAGVAADVRGYLDSLGLYAAAVIPVSARHGDNIVAVGQATPWHAGPTLLGALDALEPPPAPYEQDLRLPVQDVYRQGDERVIVGRIESGSFQVGDRITLSPTRQTARIKSIESWPNEAPKSGARAGQSVALTLDEELFVERGMIVAGHDAAPRSARVLGVRLFWLDRSALQVGDRLRLRLGTAETEAAVTAIDEVLDVETLGTAAGTAIGQNDVARVTLTLAKPLALDRYAALAGTGRGVLVRDWRLAGGFVVESLATSADLTRVDAPVTPAERAQRNGHRGGVVWMTGLSGAGKSTIATALIRRLTDRGAQAALVDGDTLRLGLNRDLGFSDEARAENIRRAAEVARLFAETGLIAVVSLIAPRAADRAAARDIVGEGFREVFVKASLQTCERRDPKGLYARARKGEIGNFTGVSAPYEAPEAADLVLDTDRLTLGEAVEQLVEAVDDAYYATERVSFAEGI